MTKLLVLGIDGADFEILDPLFENDRLPNLEQFPEEGISGTLKSTIPPATCPGWQSFYSGKSPGNIGIYGFQNFAYGSYDSHLADSSDLTESTYWELLGDHDQESCVVGGPFTYPPQPVQGAMVSGPWTPSEAESVTYPPELWEEIQDVCDGEYVFMPDNYDEAEYKEAFDRRTAVATRLLSSRDWDVFTLVYRPDPLQHIYWDKDDDVIFRVYEHMDECIGEVLDVVESLDEEVNVLVMSDHGFEGVRRRYFHVNQWLENEGYLSTKRDLTTTLLKYLPLDFGMNVASKLGVLWFIKKHVVSDDMQEAVANPLQSIAWEETEAFFIWEQQTGQIYVNIEDRFPQGRVPSDRRGEVARSILEDIQSVTDPDGRTVIDDAWLGDELYAGTEREIAPDVIFTMHPEYTCQGTFGNVFSTLDRERAEGGHHIDGILFASGPDFGEGSIEGAEIVDLAPTILHLRDAPVEANMDGDVLFELFAAESDAVDRDIETVEREGGDRTDADWSDDQRDEIEDRLEDLGYL